MTKQRLLLTLLVVFVALFTAPLFAQQTGAVHGRVTASDGSALPGVTVEARSNVLPQPRVTTTDGNGDFRLPALQPGTYTLTFTLSGMQTSTRKANVQLGQDTPLDTKLGVAGVSESITVTAQATLVDKQSTAIQSGLSQQEIQQLPVLQNYGDLQKLIPGVMYTQDAYRGPSAGASGQDNVYMFDGVNITMPLFGVLNAQPNTHDIAQVNVVKGGANAIDFNRAAGFMIDTVSKSGTNKFSGEIGYQARNHNFVANQVGTQSLTYDQDRNWSTVNLGGPILGDRLFFYGSYYRPEYTRSNQGNVYGTLPQYSFKTTEEFLKLTYTPTQSILLNGSYRYSKTKETSGAFGAFQAPTTGSGSNTKLQLGTFDGSWVINPNSFATLKLTDYRNPGGGSSDYLANGAQVSTALGTQLDLANLSTIGRLIVPTLSGTNTAYNTFVQPYISKYGYPCPQNPGAQGLTCTAGVITGGGTVGYGQFAQDNDSFFRKAAQVAYNFNFGVNVTHDFHLGYLHDNENEDRYQTSNGWGSITIPGGIGTAGTCPSNVASCAGQPVFFAASFPQQTTGAVPTLHSSFMTQGFEINDVIRMHNWTYNVGLLATQDTLYGQGLQAANNIAGWVSAAGVKYKMHQYGFADELQPRLGATWAYNGTDTVFASGARYVSAANSDARAASWDRNLVTTISAYFDANGKLIGVQPNASSSGKWFQAGIKPPEVKELMLGTARQETSRWSGRVYTRYRKGSHFVEDTNNTARADFGAPAGTPTTPYVPNLGSTSTAGSIRNAIGSGSSYVIANLDGAFTKYYEATVEQEWRGDRLTINGTYTWSHYYGNFDQDNSTFSSANDAAIFIGSSNIGDGAGRQLWNYRYGDLRGDRRNVVKLHGTYSLPWRATVGAFGVYQSGQPYQLESVLPYRPLTGSTSDTNRYAEPAGSRRSPGYYDLDLNYTQNFNITHGLNLQLAFDVFNATNNQEGYNYETRIGTLGFTSDKSVKQVPIPSSISDATLKALLSPNATFVRSDWGVRAPYANSFYAPRRFQIAARIQF